jgi:hypothetical protein
MAACQRSFVFRAADGRIERAGADHVVAVRRATMIASDSTEGMGVGHANPAAAGAAAVIANHHIGLGQKRIDNHPGRVARANRINDLSRLIIVIVRIVLMPLGEINGGDGPGGR